MWSLESHWDKNGECSCPKIYPCSKCGVFCTEHDLMCDTYICQKCWEDQWDSYLNTSTISKAKLDTWKIKQRYQERLKREALKNPT